MHLALRFSVYRKHLLCQQRHPIVKLLHQSPKQTNCEQNQIAYNKNFPGPAICKQTAGKIMQKRLFVLSGALSYMNSFRESLQAPSWVVFWKGKADKAQPVSGDLFCAATQIDFSRKAKSKKCVQEYDRCFFSSASLTQAAG